MDTLVLREMEKSAVFSPCRKYRYELWRRWDDGPYLLIIGLNPSTADEYNDDPTIRREVDFAKQWGYAALCKVNAFAWRDTKPENMKKACDPIGPENDATIMRLAAKADLILGAWGNHGIHRDRDKQIKQMILGIHCLAVTKTGQPQHPLYLPRTLKPFPLPSDDE